MKREKIKQTRVVELGGMRIGEGLPKICLSVAGRTGEEILEQTRGSEGQPVDLIEWRADYLAGNGYEDIDFQIRILEEMKKITDKPIIYTLRTEEEGGSANLRRRDYYSIVREIIIRCSVEVVDIEAFDQEKGYDGEKVEFLVNLAHDNGKKVILSNHDFRKTPTEEEILRRLIIMEQLGADIPKMAVMPREERDVLVLLEAARLAGEEALTGPFVALSMGELGQVSRICGGSFGSAITFAAGSEETAPGQLGVQKLHECICAYYENAI